MVAIVAGSGLGLYNTSLGLLGLAGQAGQAGTGRSGDQVYINASNGNLVVRQQDEWLVGVGVDAQLLRTYNSQATSDGDNNDNWRLGLSRRVMISGPNVVRVAEDGSQTTYYYDAASGLYTSKDGAGAHDSMVHLPATNEVVWTDGTTGVKETYALDPNAAGQWRLSKITEPSGAVLTLGYSGTKVVSIATSNQEMVQINYYEGTNNIESLVTFFREKNDGSGAIKAIKRVSYQYNNNRLSKVVVDLTPDRVDDAAFYETTYEYVDGTSNKLSQILQSDGSALIFTYDGNRISGFADWRGSTENSTISTFSYGTNKTTVTTGSGGLTQVTEFTYETAAGQNLQQLRELKVQDGAGGAAQSSAYQYDADGNVQTITDGRGNVTTYGYDAFGNRNYERDAAGNVITRVFSTDRKNLLLSETLYVVPDPDAGGALQPSGPQTTRYAYDAQSNLRFVVSAEGRVTEHRYESTTNGLGQRTSTIQYAANRYTVSGLTPSQQLQLSDLQAWLSSTSAPVNKSQAQRTDFTYDFRGQVDRQITYAALDASGNGVVSDGSQTSIQFVYDQAGNLLQSIDSRGDELATRDTPWAQLVRGQMTLSVTAAGLDNNAKAALRGLFTTTYQYDGLNRLTLVRNAQGDTQTLYVDGARQTLVGQANGLWTVNVYDQANRLLSSQQTTVAGADFGTTTYTYDILGRLRAVTSPGTDASGRKAYYIYDKAGRVVGEIGRDGALTETIYNGNSQVVRKIRYATLLDTALVPGDGTSLTMEMVRPLALQAGAVNRTERILYDKSGRVSRTIDAQGAVVDYQYDGTGWLAKKTAYATLLSEAQLQALATAEAAGELNLAVAAVQSNSKPAVSVDDRSTRSYHDAEGLLTGTVDAENYFTKYTYDDAGRLTGITRYANALQNAASLGSTIPGVGAQTGAYVLTDVRDQTTTQLYNAKGQLTGVIDAADFLTEFSYDTSGRKVLEVRYANIANRLAGTAVAQVRPVATTEDRKTYYQYDSVGQLVAVERQPEGLIINHVYDSVGRLLQTTQAAAANAQSRIVQRRYDVAGRLTSELSAQASANVSSDYAAWLAANSGASQSAKDDKVAALWATYGTRYTYDAAGRMLSSTAPDGVGATGLKTLYYYDAQGRVAYTVNALGEVAKYVYNAFGEQIEAGRYRHRLSASSMGAGGYAKTFAASLTADFLASYQVDSQTGYNRLGKVELSTVSGQAQAFSFYSAFGELSAQLVANGTGVTRSDHLYDRRGLKLSTKDDTGGVERLVQAQYDAFGRVTKTIDAKGAARTSTYDRLGREITTFDPANAFTQTTYDAFGRVLTFTDRQLATTIYVYDSPNRKLTATTPEGIQTITESNVHGDVVKVTVQHKDKGLSTVDSLSRVTVYEYNANGKVTSVTSAQGSGAQSSVTTEYDKAGRVFKITDATGTVTQTTYDAANRVMKRQVDPAGLNLTTEYFYDAKGRAAWVKDASGVWTQTEYDSQGRVQAVTVDPRKVPHTGLTYDARTPLDLSTLVNNPVAGGGLALRTEYTYDAASQVVTVAEGVNSTLAANDVQRYANARITSYVYDALGRRVAEVLDPKRTPLAAAGAQDRPAGIEARTTYSYDKNGNVIARMDATGSTTRYIYNDNNQVTHTVDATGAVTQNTYDADGRLTQTRQYAGKLTQSTGLKVWHRDGTASQVQRPLGRFLLGDVVTVTVRAKAADNTKASLAIANASFVGASVDTKFGTRDADGWQTLTVTYTLTKDEDLIAYLGGDRDGVSSSDGRHVIYDNLVVNSVKRSGVLNDTFDTLTLDNPQVATSYFASGQAELTSYVRLDAATLTDAQIRTATAALANADKDQTTTYVYNKDGKLTHTVDALNYVTKHVYDAAGNVVQTTRFITALSAAPTPAQVNGDVKWFAAAEPATNIRDRVERFAYDQANRLIWSLDAEGYATQTLYEQSGLKITQKRYANPVIYADGNSSLKINVAPLPVITPPTSGAYIVKDDTNDRTLVRQLDAVGREKSVKDAAGYLTTKSYDLAGNLKSVTRFTEASSLTQDETDTGNAVQRFEYDSAGRVIKAINAEGAVTVNEYDLAGNLIASTVGYGGSSAVKSVYAYDGAGRLLQETVGADKPEAATTRYELDGAGRRTKVIDPRGIELAESNSAWAQALRKTLIGTWVAPVAGSNDYLKLLNAYATRQEFDARGQVIASVDALGGRTLTDYDAFGNAVKVTDPRGKVGHFFFDRLGQKNWSIDPLGYATQTVYDGLGQVISVVKYSTAVSGTVTPGQPPKLFDTQQAATTANATFYIVKQGTKDATTGIAYDKVGRQTAIIDAEGFGESNVFNGFGDKTSFTAKSSTAVTINAAGTYTYTYDKLGRVLTETSPVLTKELDAAGNIKLTNGQPTMKAVITAFKYDSRGNVIRKTEAQGLVEQRITNYTYDKQNRLIGQTRQAMTMVSVQPDGTATQTAGVVPTETRNYDARGNLIELYTNAGERTLYYYDALDRRVAQLVATGTRADGVYGAYVEFEYDKAGNIVKQSAYSSLLKLPAAPGGTVPRPDINTASDRITSFEYDANNLLRSQTIKAVVAGKVNAATGNYELTVQDLVTRYTYDAAGNQTSVEDGRGNKTYFYYDAAGQRIAQVDAENYITVWSYDDKGNVTLESKASTRWAGAQPPSATAGAALPAAVAANTYGDKRTTTYTYDRMGRLKTQTITAVVVGSFQESPNLIVPTAVDITTSYDYNGLGAVIKKTEGTTDTLLWEFDAMGREKRRRGAEYLEFGGTDLVRRTEDTEYNGLGNKLRSIEQDKTLGTIDGNDRIRTYFYSENGYLTKEVDAAGNAVTYQYDIAGRVAARSVSRQDHAGAFFTDTKLYGYDVAGRQVDEYVVSKTGNNAAVTVAGSQLRRSSTQYSAFGDIASKLLNGEVTETATYDTAGRLMASKAANGVPTVYLRDASGNITMTITPPADEQTAAAASAMAEFFKYEAYSVEDINAAINAGAHANVAVFDKRNLQTDVYELTSLPVMTNDGGIVEANGSKAQWIRSETVEKTTQVLTDNGIWVNYVINVHYWWHYTKSGWGGGRDYYLDRMDWTVNATLNGGSPSAGDSRYVVELHVDQGFYATNGRGFMHAVNQRVPIDISQGNVANFTYSNHGSENGSVFQDSGGVTGAGFRVSVYKDTNPTAPNVSLVEVSRWASYANPFNIRDGVPFTWGPPTPVQSFNGQYFRINNAPVGTTQVYFQYRSPGSTTWRQVTVAYTSGAATVYRSALNLNELMSTASKSGYIEYAMSMVNASGQLLEFRQGDIWSYYNNSNQLIELSYPSIDYGDGLQNPSGSFFMGAPLTTGGQPAMIYVHPDRDRKPTDPKGLSVRLKYRAEGQTSQWIEVPGSINWDLTPDRFSFDPAARGMSVSGQRYELMLEVKDALNGGGNTLYTVTTDFVYYPSNVADIRPSAALTVQSRPSTFNFTNLPLAAATARVEYTVTTPSGTTTGQATLVKTDDGRFYWDAATIVPFTAGGTKYIVDYKLFANAVNGDLLVNGFAGREVIGAGNSDFSVTVQSLTSSSTTYSRTSASKITFAVGSAWRSGYYYRGTGREIKNLSVYYRLAGTQGPYTKQVVAGNIGPSGFVESFTLDLSSQLGTTNEFLDFDVYYEYDISASYYPVAPTAADPIKLRVVNEATAQATLANGVMQLQAVTNRLTSNHQRSVYNAYGEVVQEFDALSFERIRAQETTLGRSLTASELDDQATTLSYNSMGLLISKRTPKAKATMKSGWETAVRAETTYVYDKQGRLIAEQDALGNQVSYKLLAAGQGERIVAMESHMDGGKTTLGFDVFGDLRRRTVTNDVDAVTDYTYDKLHNLVRADKPTGAGGKRATDLYTYDSVGNQIRHQTSPDVSANASNVFVNGRIYAETTRFDALGRVTEVRSGIASGVDPVTLAAVSHAGLARTISYQYTGATMRQTFTDENGYVSETWTDAFGRQTKKIDLGGRNALMTYNLAGNMILQYQAVAGTTTKVVGGQDITYRYYGNGQIKSIVDRGIQTLANYEYDRNGNKTYEGYGTLDGLTPYQRTNVVYDELNRIVGINDYHYSLIYEYDKVGNRRRVAATRSGETAVQDYWYDYDNMNRMVVSMGKLNAARATSDTGDNRITQVGSASGVLLGYDRAGNRRTAAYASGANDAYSYTADGFLTTTTVTGTASGTTTRTNDLLGRVTNYSQSSAAGQSSQKYTYLADGRVAKVEATETNGDKTTTTNNYNALAGGREMTLLQTSQVFRDMATGPDRTDYYRYSYTLYDSALQSEIRMGATTPVVDPAWGRWAEGVSQLFYDANGHVKSVKDSRDASGTNLRTISYVNNAQGQVLTRSELGAYVNGSPVFQSYYYVNGRRVGESGNQPSASTIVYADALQVDRSTQGDKYTNIKPITSNFDQNYQPVNESYPAFVGSTHIVVAGETLESIALTTWGDAKMWYLIAEANNILDKSAKLVEGVALVIPNKVTNVHNSSLTYKVYNAGEALGDISPTLPPAPTPPPPTGGGGCGVMGAVLMAVVAIAATVFTMGALGPAMVGLMGPLAGTLATGAIAGAVGSIASQGVGMLTGNVDKFSWSAVASGAITGAVTAGIGGGSFKGAYEGIFASSNALGSVGNALGNFSPVALNVAKAVTTNVISQGVGMAVGLQKKFSWTSVAVSGVGAVASAGASSLMGKTLGNGVLGEWGGSVMRNTISGMAAGWAGAMVRHQKPDWAMIAADSFGNALGDGLVKSIASAAADKKTSSSNPVDGKVIAAKAMTSAIFDYAEGVDGFEIPDDDDEPRIIKASLSNELDGRGRLLKQLEDLGWTRESMQSSLESATGVDFKEIGDLVNDVRKGIEKQLGLEDSIVRKALEKGLPLVFKGLEAAETAVERGVAKTPLTAALVGIYELAKNSSLGVGKFHELVVKNVLDQTGLFEEGSLRAVQNNSDQGVDLIGKAASGALRGDWIGLELKASGHAMAPGLSKAQQAGPNKYIRSRLEAAVNAGPRWKSGTSADSSLAAFADRVLHEQGFKDFQGFVIQTNRMYDRQVTTKVSPWPNQGVQPPGKNPPGGKPKSTGGGNSKRWII